MNWSPKKVEFFGGDQYGPLYCLLTLGLVSLQTGGHDDVPLHAAVDLDGHGLGVFVVAVDDVGFVVVVDYVGSVVDVVVADSAGTVMDHLGHET